jgi:ribosome-associated protein
VIAVTDTIALDERELEERFILAGGPGGQNVNKVASAVQLRFDAANSPALPGDVRERLRRLAGSRMTADGVIIITAARFRSQERNRADARERLVDLIRRATVRPVKRRPTKPSAAARRQRVEAKVRRGAIKQGRGKPGLGD